MEDPIKYRTENKDSYMEKLCRNSGIKDKHIYEKLGISKVTFMKKKVISILFNLAEIEVLSEIFKIDAIELHKKIVEDYKEKSEGL